MKYLKNFESQSYTYRLGDYVAIDLRYLKLQGEGENFGKIIEIDDHVFEGTPVPYLVLFNSGFDGWASESMIERRLDEHEIEEFELKFNANKYNI